MLERWKKNREATPNHRYKTTWHSFPSFMWQARRRVEKVARPLHSILLTETTRITSDPVSPLPFAGSYCTYQSVMERTETQSIWCSSNKLKSSNSRMGKQETHKKKVWVSLLHLLTLSTTFPWQNTIQHRFFFFEFTIIFDACTALPLAVRLSRRSNPQNEAPKPRRF